MIPQIAAVVGDHERVGVVGPGRNPLVVSGRHRVVVDDVRRQPRVVKGRLAHARVMDGIVPELLARD